MDNNDPHTHYPSPHQNPNATDHRLQIPNATDHRLQAHQLVNFCHQNPNPIHVHNPFLYFSQQNQNPNPINALPGQWHGYGDGYDQQHHQASDGGHGFVKSHGFVKTEVDGYGYERQHPHQASDHPYGHGSVKTEVDGYGYEQQHPHQALDPYGHGFTKTLDSLPAGYRFDPRDHELIRDYLAPRVHNLPLPPNNFHEINLYSHHPATLAKQYKPCRENEWYFFTPRTRKYKNGKRPTRTAKDGYWKATGADKKIMFQGAVIGFKKSLVFYEGKAGTKGKNTDWHMHEFTLVDPPAVERKNANDMTLDDWVLCKIYIKNAKKSSSPEKTTDVLVEEEKMILEDDIPHNMIMEDGLNRFGEWEFDGFFGDQDIENHTEMYHDGSLITRISQPSQIDQTMVPGGSCNSPSSINTTKPEEGSSSCTLHSPINKI